MEGVFMYTDRRLVAFCLAAGLVAAALVWPQAVQARACNRQPVLSIAVPTAAPVASTVTFTGSVRSGNGQAGCKVTGWTLAFGDGETQTGTALGGFTTTHAYVAVGAVTVTLSAVTAGGQKAAIARSLTISPANQPVDSTYGPKATIVCPDGAVSVSPGSSIQTAVTANGNGTAFCLRAGVHTISASIVPKTGNTFVGEYGAVLDGTGWTSNDLDDAMFRSVNTGVTGVTIKNLVLRHGPSYGVNSYLTSASWVVDHNEIFGFRTGVSVGTAGVISHNYIHNNVGDSLSSNPAERGGGYALNASLGVSLTDNEISYNGFEQKFIAATQGELNQNLTIARNFVHHNLGNGLWIDGDGAGSVIENNRIEDNGAAGIDVEQGNGVIVRNNTVRRQLAGEGIYITISKGTSITGNVLEGNAFGIGLFLDFASLPPNSPDQPWHQDLSGNTITGNTVRISAGQYGGMLSITGSGDKTPYTSNSKNNVWSGNVYYAPTTTANYFFWDANKTFAQWQALPQDVGGSIAVQ